MSPRREPDKRSRREFLSTLGATTAAVVGAGGCAKGCSNRRPQLGSWSNAAEVQRLLPRHHPMQLVEPDIPAEAPLSDAYLHYPKEKFPRVIDEKPGRGGPTITTMLPAWGPAPPGLGNSAYLDAVNAELGVQVDPSVQDGNTYSQKLSAILGARDIPDVLCAPYWEVDKIPRFSDAVKALFADLTPYLQGESVKRYRMLATVPTRAWQYCCWGSRLVAIPYPTGDPFPWVMFFRKDLTDKLGVEPPRTIDDLYRFGKKLTNPRKNVWAFGDTFEMIQMYFEVPGAETGWRKKPGGGLVFKYETPEFKQAVEFTTRLYQEGLVHPDLVASNGADAGQLFKSGRILMHRNGMGAWLNTQRDQQKLNPEFNMQPLSIFSATGGEPMMWANEKPVFYTFIKKGLSKDRMHEILSVLNWCAAPFGSFEFEFNQYGVEGKHFRRAPDNSPIQTDLGRKELVGQFGIISGRVPVTVGTSEVPNYVPDAMAYAKETVKHLEESPFSGIKLEYPPAYSKLIVSTEEKFKDVVRGRRPVSDVDEIVAEWRRSGGDLGRAFFERALAANGR